jgi:hypothetical protein
MDAKIRSCRYVLMICTDGYRRRVMGTEAPGTGHGVRWEGNLIYQHLYDAGSLNSKFIPVIVAESDRQYVPTPVRGATIYSIAASEGYESLYERLAGVTPAKPALGVRRALPAKPVKTNPIMYVTGPIDVDLWNRAQWKAVFYGDGPDGSPILGLAFRNRDAATVIFRGWHERYGDRDLEEELRIAIIEGEIPGEEPGYSVHINTDAEGFIRRLKAAGFNYSDDLLFTVGRIHRMNPYPGSPFLARFQREYRRAKTYWLVPGVIDESEQVEMISDLRIFKSRISFRNVSDLRDDDLDSVVLHKVTD